MPTYDYHCSACDAQFEYFQSMSSEPLKVCIRCGKSKLRRLIGGGAGLIFKGSGFYVTDYKNKNRKEPSVNKSKDSTDKTKIKAKSD